MPKEVTPGECELCSAYRSLRMVTEKWGEYFPSSALEKTPRRSLQGIRPLVSVGADTAGGIYFWANRYDGTDPPTTVGQSSLGR
jgi:hypothetical protein